MRKYPRNPRIARAQITLSEMLVREETFKVKDKYLIYLSNILLKDENAPVRAPRLFMRPRFESWGSVSSTFIVKHTVSVCCKGKVFYEYLYGMILSMRLRVPSADLATVF